MSAAGEHDSLWKKIEKLETENTKLREGQAQIMTTLFGVEGNNGLNRDMKDVKKDISWLKKHIYIAVGIITALTWLIRHYDFNIKF